MERKWEAKKEYFLQYKKDGSHPPCIDLAMALHGFDIDNTAAHHAIEDSKALHARRWQTKEGIYRIKRQALSTMTMLRLLAQMSNRDGGTGMKTLLWDINVILTEQDKGYLMLPRGVQHMRALGSFGRFTLFSPPVSPSNGVFGLGVFVCFVVFLFPVLQVSWNFLNPPRVLDLDDRQGLIASSAMQ